MRAEDTGNVPSAVEQFECIESFARVLRERTDRKVWMHPRDVRREPTHERWREECFQGVRHEEFIQGNRSG